MSDLEPDDDLRDATKAVLRELGARRDEGRRPSLDEVIEAITGAWRDVGVRFLRDREPVPDAFPKAGQVISFNGRRYLVGHVIDDRKRTGRLDYSLLPLRTPQAWSEESGVTILDPDGWRHAFTLREQVGHTWSTEKAGFVPLHRSTRYGPRSYDDEITEAEFHARAAYSTTREG